MNRNLGTLETAPLTLSIPPENFSFTGIETTMSY